MDPDGKILVVTSELTSEYINSGRPKILDFSNAIVKNHNGKLRIELPVSKMDRHLSSKKLSQYIDAAINIQTGNSMGRSGLSASMMLTIKSTKLVDDKNAEIFLATLSVTITDNRDKDSISYNTGGDLFYFTERDNLANKQAFIDKTLEILREFNGNNFNPNNIDISINDERALCNKEKQNE